MPVSHRTDLKQLQTSTNSSDTESKLEFRGGTTQSLFSVFERHTVYYIDETCGYVGHAAGSYEECDEKPSEVTSSFNLVAILHLYPAIDHSVS